MFEQKSLDRIDGDYFNIIIADSQDVTIQSRNTGHYWYLHCAGYPTEEALVISCFPPFSVFCCLRLAASRLATTLIAMRVSISSSSMDGVACWFLSIVSVCICSTSLSEWLSCLSIFLSASGNCFSGREHIFLKKF